MVDVKGSSVCVHSFLPPRLRRFRERKAEILRSDETPDLIHHWYTNTTTVTDNVTGGRNRKIWRFLGSVWDSFHDRVPLACRRHPVYSLWLWQTHTRIHIPPPLLRAETPETCKPMSIPTSQETARPDENHSQQFITHDIKGSCLMTHTRDPEGGQDLRSRLRDCEPALKTSVETGIEWSTGWTLCRGGECREEDEWMEKL